jgi:hypothetical protein
VRASLRSAGAALLAGVGVLMLFAVARSQQDGLNAKCQSYAKLDVRGLLLYAEDYDERLPLFKTPTEFQSLLAAYAGSPEHFFCPVTGLIYQPNTALSGQWVYGFADPDTTEVLRDLHPHEDGGTTIAYLDGHTVYNGKNDEEGDQACADNAGQLARAVTLYTQDYDETLPPLVNEKLLQYDLLPYVREKRLFLCPVTNLPFQPNRVLSGKPLSAFSDLTHTDDLYEPAPHADRLYTLGFLDGHASHGSAYSDGSPPPTGERCLKTAREINLALEMYAQDYDETFPPMHTPNEVQNALNPYLRGVVFACPVTGLSYQQNVALSGQTLASIAAPKTTETFRDAQPHYDPPDALFGNTIAYADGHVIRQAVSQNRANPPRPPKTK